LFCRKPGYYKKSCFKPKTKEAQNGHASNFNGNAERRNYESQEVVFTATLKNKIPKDDNWICDSGACRHYNKSDKGLFDVKVGSLKFHVIQLIGSNINVTLKEVKYVREL
jgi:hypothetical protein